jgi:hypothetical protein
MWDFNETACFALLQKNAVRAIKRTIFSTFQKSNCLRDFEQNSQEWSVPYLVFGDICFLKKTTKKPSSYKWPCLLFHKPSMSHYWNLLKSSPLCYLITNLNFNKRTNDKTNMLS